MVNRSDKWLRSGGEMEGKTAACLRTPPSMFLGQRIARGAAVRLGPLGRWADAAQEDDQKIRPAGLAGRKYSNAKSRGSAASPFFYLPAPGFFPASGVQLRPTTVPLQDSSSESSILYMTPIYDSKLLNRG